MKKKDTCLPLAEQLQWKKLFFYFLLTTLSRKNHFNPVMDVHFLIPALRRLKYEDCNEFEAVLDIQWIAGQPGDRESHFNFHGIPKLLTIICL